MDHVHRFVHEQITKGIPSDAPRHLHGVDGVQQPVGIDGDADFSPHRLAHGGDPRLGSLTVGDVETEAGALDGCELHRAETLLQATLRVLGITSGFATVDPGVTFDALADTATEQLPHRHTEGLFL